MSRRLARCLLVVGTVSCVWAPAPARADGWLVPWFGSAFAQDPDDTGRASVGVSYGSVSSGDLFGFELDFGYTPSFFGTKSAVGKNSVVTLMADLIAGPSFETRAGKGRDHSLQMHAVDDEFGRTGGDWREIEQVVTGDRDGRVRHHRR
jgi:hypothetical protein